MLLTDYNWKSAFTYIELIVVIVVISILSVGGAHLMRFFIQNAIYIPHQLSVDMLNSEAFNIMIEGDPQAKGLRFCKRINSMDDNQVTFTNENDDSVSYQLNTITNQLYRQINGNPSTLFPYYWPSGIVVAGKNNKAFIYLDSNEAVIDPVTGNPANVRRVAIDIVAQTGTGAFNQWEGQAELNSSIAVNRY